MPPYNPVPDPFPDKQRPIPAGAPGFYAREETFTDVRDRLRAGDSVSVVGERKAGKTSFLNHLLTRLPDDEFIPVLVDAQGVAPQTDKLFLAALARSAARAMAKVLGLSEPLETDTLQVSPDKAYLTFGEDLERLRAQLSLGSNGRKRRLVWLIDEIDTLRGYEESELFAFLRPLAQSDPDFRMVVAGYDVLYTLSSRSEWSPFFNAFRHTRLEGLNPVVARQLTAEALTKMGATMAMEVATEPNLYGPILDWTGRKPYFLKWILSEIAQALNQRQTDYVVGGDVLQTARRLFLAQPELFQHFAHLWDSHTTPRQRTTLSLMASQAGPYDHPTMLDHRREKKLVEGDKRASQHLVDDLTRLRQLGFLYEQVGRYTFTSGCLQDWVRENKPLE